MNVNAYCSTDTVMCIYKHVYVLIYMYVCIGYICEYILCIDNIVLLGEVHRVMSLRSPLHKMSKSDNQETSRINLSDTPDEIHNKIRKSVTDCESRVTFDPHTRPGVSNLVSIYSAITGLTHDEVVELFIGKQTVELKDALVGILVEHLAPIRQELTRLDNEDGFVREVLDNGAKMASERAQETVALVHTTLGIS